MQGTNGASWGAPSPSKWDAPPTKDNKQVASTKADRWNQATMAMAPAPAAQARGKGDVTAVFNQVLEPALQGKSEMPVVSNISHDYVAKAAEKGPLSYEEHQRQMIVVDQVLNQLTKEQGDNLKIIRKIVERFSAYVDACNDKITIFTSSILDRAAREDPSLQPEDVPKALAILSFTEQAVKTMSVTSHLAVDLTERGASVIAANTKTAILVIFEARKKEVELFTDKLKVFHMQEQHELDKMLKFQQARLQEQQQLFNQMKEVVQMKLEHDKTVHTHQMEERKADLEFQVQQRSLDIKEEEVQFTQEFKLAELSVKEKLETKQMKINQKLDNKRIDVDSGVKHHAIDADERARNWTATNDRMAREKESGDKKDAAIADSAFKAVQPACTIQ